MGDQINLFHAVKACPCNLDAMCKGPPNPHIINPWDCTWSRYHPGWWYFGHGGGLHTMLRLCCWCCWQAGLMTQAAAAGAGAVLSSGLFRRATYSDVENKVANQCAPANAACPRPWLQPVLRVLLWLQAGVHLGGLLLHGHHVEQVPHPAHGPRRALPHTAEATAPSCHLQRSSALTV